MHLRLNQVTLITFKLNVWHHNAKKFHMKINFSDSYVKVSMKFVSLMLAIFIKDKKHLVPICSKYSKYWLQDQIPGECLSYVLITTLSKL